MKASDLNERIEIYQASSSRTATHAFDTDYEYKCSTRARVNYLSGNLTTSNEEIVYPVDRTFIVRHYVPVVDTDQIRWDNKKWQIISVDRSREYNNIIIKTVLVNE